MLGNVALFYAFWILIFHCYDSSTISVSSPVQAVVGWNASFNMQLDPYPNSDAIITITKNGTLIMFVKGTVHRNVAERFEFTGNTAENGISFILRNVTLRDAGTYIATETSIPRGEQKLIVKASPSKPQIIALTSSVLGSDYQLNCSSVSNSAPPDHGLFMMSEWKVNDQLITTGQHYRVQGTELTITSITRQDNNLKLTCVAYEDSLAKSDPSSEHVIDVKYGPDNVQLNPSGGIIKVIENHPVIIGCTADCNPICSFRWRRGSVPGYLKSNQTLMIDSVGKSDADNYTCTVYNGITGRSQSLQTTLVVIYGPSSGQVMFSTTQSNQIVEDNTLLNITCSADCYPPCSFTWTGPQGFSQPGAQLSRFVDRNNGGNYICTASNQENLGKSAMASIIVIVMYGPGSSINLGSNPPTIIVNLHQRAPDITCSATCNPPCDYRWYRKRTLYSNGATLSLGVVENKTSGGNYTCEAYNKVLGLDQSSSTSININVYYGAEIVSLSVLDSNTVNENSSAIFQCQVDSNPLPTITWRNEGTNTVLKTESGVVQSQFRIESAQCQDTNNYTCSAYNEIRTQANDTLQFFVKCHPRRDSEVPLQPKVYKKLHEAAFLRYTVISYPLPKFIWMFLGNGSESKDLPGSASPYVNGRLSELRFTSLNMDDFGYYSVIADNSLPPSAREVFEIIPAGTPGKPLNFHSTNIQEKQLSLRWQSGYDGGLTQTFVVEISLNNITWNNVSEVSAGNRDGWFTTVIEDLIPGSEYYLRLYAYNILGRGDFADVQLVIRMLKEVSASVGISVGGAVGIGVGGIVLGLIAAIITFTIRRQLNGPTNSCFRSTGKRDEEMHPYSNTEMNQQTVKPIYEELNKGNTERSVYDKISPL